jgi:hypothetical protein
MAFRKRRPAFTRWGGWEAGLSVLRTSDPTRLDPLDRSGLRHLAAHLESGGHEDDLHQLLRLEWAEENAPLDPDPCANAWFRIHDQANDLDGYMNDISRAWRLADREMEINPSARALGRQLRAALISASIGNLATNIPAPLLIEIVKARLWPAAQALAFARQMSDPGKRGQTLIALAPTWTSGCCPRHCRRRGGSAMSGRGRRR